MNRPYVICHMLTSLDGRIDGGFMGSEANKDALGEYGRLRSFHGCTATLYGTVTMAESYADGFAFIRGEDEGPSPYLREDYVAPTEVKRYIVSIDPNGQLAWHGNTIEKKGRPKAHVVEVLTHGASDAYLAYLRGFEISYLFAGREKLDCRLALQKLKELFGIERLMVAGGGEMNGSLLRGELIDEMSIVLSPTIEGDRKAASLADYTLSGAPQSPAAFSLIEAKPLNDALWLRYKRIAEEECL